MSSKDLMARLAAGKQEQKESKAKTEFKAEPAEVTRNFEITEADIKSNAAYEIITNTKLSDQKKLHALEALKTYNKDLPEEENEANVAAVNEALLYIENQLMASSQKGIEFTNDNAFALYDETIQELFGNIKTFKGYIEPFVMALEVLQKARNAGISANELIDHVAGLQENIGQMKSDKETKEAELANLQSELNGFNVEATRTTEKLEQLQKDMEAANKAKSDAEKSWNIIKKGEQIKAAQSRIDSCNRQIETLNSTAAINVDNLGKKNAAIEALTAEIEKLGTDLTAAEEEFTANEDSVAIATLIEITGADFKDKREEVVKAAQTITEKAIEGIEKSISRFDSGKDETGQQLDTITNLNGMVGLLSTSDKKAQIANARFVSEQKEIVDRIFAEKGDDSKYDPDYQLAKEHLDKANSHVEGVNSTAERAMDLGGKLTKQSGTFKGLRDAYGQKGQDATRLRTSAAVEIPSQLAVTVKSVEMATATESNNMVNDAFADLSRTTQKSVSSIFDTVSAGAGQNNEQLRKTLESTMNTIEMMNSVEADLKAKAAEAYEVRQSLDTAQAALKEVTGSVASAGVDATHEEMAKAAAPKAPRP